MTATPEQNWQPISMLPMIAQLVDDMLDGARQQHDVLAAAPRYSLDNATLDRVEGVYGDGLDGHPAFENQLARWQHEHPDAQGLTRLAGRVGQLRPSYQRVLDLTLRLRASTIEALLGKSDLEVGMEALGDLLTGIPTGPRYPRQA